MPRNGLEKAEESQSKTNEGNGHVSSLLQPRRVRLPKASTSRVLNLLHFHYLSKMGGIGYGEREREGGSGRLRINAKPRAEADTTGNVPRLFLQERRVRRRRGIPDEYPTHR